MTQVNNIIAKLKEEGNALFVQKKYGPAIFKYSEAIALDDTNAIIYANRAASRMALKKYMDALSDAAKATELDPTYAKGWARKGAALDALGRHGSIEAWQRALGALPKENLSPSELKQKEQYESSLEAAFQALEPKEDLPPDAYEVKIGEGKMPWVVAYEMIDAVEGVGIDDSGGPGPYIVLGKYVLSGFPMHIITSNSVPFKDFRAGLQIMAKQQEIEHGDQVTILAEGGAVQAISNAILKDERVFAIQPEVWVPKFHRQTMAEIHELRGWTGNEGPEIIKKEALERLKKKGWSDLRPALMLTVRAWIMQGFLIRKLPTAKNSYSAAVEYLRRALEIIDWGREIWKSVPRDARGIVFETTFRRGVWRMLLNFLESEFHQNQTDMELLESIYKEAQGLIDDVEANPLNYDDFDIQPDPGFVWAFFRAPLGDALAAQGLYHVHKANAILGQREKRDHWLAAGRCYRDAALRGFAEDDKYYSWFLRCAYVYWLPCELPTRDMLDIMEKIRLALPKMRTVWYQHRGFIDMDQEKEYNKLQKLEKRIRRLIRSGNVKMDDPFKEVIVV